MWARVEAAMAKQIRRISPPTRPLRDARAEAVAAQITRDFGAFVPPFALHAAVPDLLAACWTMLRESLGTVHVDRARKEAVASAVSRANACTYCVDAHTTALAALGDTAAADALARPAGGAAAMLDPAHALAALTGWAAATGNADDARLHPRPFAPAETPEIVGIAFCFHYVNRMVAIFLVSSPLPFGSPWLKALTRRTVAPLLARQLARPLPAGDSLAFLPEATPSADFAWAAGRPTIAAAFARARVAFETGGAVLAPDVRALVTDTLAAWRGECPPLGRRWLDDAVAPLAEKTRPAARFALLAALAPFQVGDDDVRALRASGADDAALVATAAWASFTAARRIAAWL